VSYVFFALLQTYVDRPVLTGGDVFTNMVRDVYAGDHPFNDFPSLHVSTSTIIAIHWWRVGRNYTWPLLVWTALIVMSTVMIRQHYVSDIAGGLALAFGTSWFFLRLIGREPEGADRAGSARAA
jgi:membrane-associated phospholipid phosphatase